MDPRLKKRERTEVVVWMRGDVTEEMGGENNSSSTENLLIRHLRKGDRVRRKRLEGRQRRGEEGGKHGASVHFNPHVNRLLNC